MKNTTLVILAVVVVIVVVAAGAFVTFSQTTTTLSTSISTNSIGVIRIGYFANINHAPAIIGLENGTFQRYLGNSTQIQTTLFTAGPTEMTALLAGQLDMAYVGPSPAVSSFLASNGSALRIVAGVSNGGAVFVVSNNSGINSTKDFGGKTFAAPQLGNTQDIALRHYLQENGYNTTNNGGNVTVVDTSNSNIISLMIKGQLDGAWVPEPYASELIFMANCHVFVDERDLWPGGNFSTAELVVSTSFLNAHPDVVKKIIEADVFETQWINTHFVNATKLLTYYTAELTSTKPVNYTIMTNAMNYLSFTYDPLESSVQQQATNAYNLGFLGTTPPDLNGLYDLTILNQVLQQDGLPQVNN